MTHQATPGKRVSPSLPAKNFRNLVFLLLFLLGTVGVGAFRLWQVKSAGQTSFIPQQSSFVFKPPADALKGKLSLFKGDVKKKPRDKEEFKDVNVGEEILQGERIATGKKSQAIVEFPNFLRVNLGSDTEIGFNNLIPANFLISQSPGSVTYELLRDATPISVRSLHVLLTVYSGKSEVVVSDETITDKVLSGQAKLALVDLENKTHIWEIKEGQQALVNDAQRRVEIK